MKYPLPRVADTVRSLEQKVANSEKGVRLSQDNLKGFVGYLCDEIERNASDLFTLMFVSSEADRSSIRRRRLGFLLLFFLLTVDVLLAATLPSSYEYRSINPLSGLMLWFWFYGFGLAWQHFLEPLGVPSVLLCYTIGMLVMWWFAGLSVKFSTRFFGIEFFIYGLIFMVIVPPLASGLIFGILFGAKTGE